MILNRRQNMSFHLCKRYIKKKDQNLNKSFTTPNLEKKKQNPWSLEIY